MYLLNVLKRKRSRGQNGIQISWKIIRDAHLQWLHDANVFYNQEQQILAVILIRTPLLFISDHRIRDILNTYL